MQLLRKNGKFEMRDDSNSLTKCENTSLLGLQSLTKNSFKELHLIYDRKTLFKEDHDPSKYLNQTSNF